MTIRIIFTSKTGNTYLKTGIDEYIKRVSRYAKLEVSEIEIKSVSPDKTSVLQKEGQKILSQVRPPDYCILLDERGEQMTSELFAGTIGKLQSGGINRIVFITGGAYGFDKNVQARANQKIALSKMTFTHQMVRLFFLEQLYRAFTILNNEKYHH